MANLNAPFGLKPETSPQGSVRREKYRLAAGTSKIFLHDPVAMQAAGDVDLAGASGALLGAIVGFIDDEGVPQCFYPGDSSTGWHVLVADDPYQEFLIQEDSGGAALALADCGLNASLLAGPGNETTGISGFSMDSSTKATTATLQLRIKRLLETPDNEVGDYARWVVTINNHFYAKASAGV